MQVFHRSLWLASAAALLSAGMACAQNAPMTPADAVPDDASLQTDLHIAAKAIHEHHQATADTALSNAETLILTRAVPQDAGIPVDNSPRVQLVEQARQALAAGDYERAERLTHRLMPEQYPDGRPIQ